MTEENKEQQEGGNIKVLRTYTSDMAEVIRNNEISAIKIAVAEKEKREQEELYRTPETTNKSKIILIGGGILLIIIGIVTSYFLINRNKEVNVVVTQDSIKKEAPIYYESSSFLDITNTNNPSDVSNLIVKEKVEKNNSIKALFFTKKMGETSNQINANEFLSAIDTAAPEELTRSLSSDYLVGKYSNTENKNSVFIILETTDYNQSYASMLKWEKTLENDILKITEKKDTIVSSEKSWKDIVVNNKDARVLYSQDGSEVLCYLFVNKKDFIITENIETMREVLERILVKNN